MTHVVSAALLLGLTPEQLDRVQKNRAQAIERRRMLDAASLTGTQLDVEHATHNTNLYADAVDPTIIQHTR